MSIGIASTSSKSIAGPAHNFWLCAVLVLALCGLPGCSNEGRSTVYGGIERNALRIKLDAERDRIWLLDLDGVRVYDAAKKRLARRIALPNWVVAGLACMPDMALDRTGSAYVSSNVQSRLWRIDAETLQVRELDIRLQGREQLDVGFGALAFAGDGTLLGLTSMGRWLWKIDLGKGSAYPVDPDAARITVCEMTPELLLSGVERSQP